MNQTKKDYCRGDIWLARLPEATGSEMDGTRPFLILQNNVGNYHGPTLIGTPLTTQIKKTHLPTHVILQNGPCAGSMAVLEQILTIDKERLIHRMGALDTKDMTAINKAAISSLGLTVHEPSLLCLCSRCVGDFRSVPGQTAKRADPYQVITEECTYCGSRLGYDYFVTENDV